MLLVLLLGVLVGTASVLLHTLWWGLVLAFAATAAVLAALPGWRRLVLALGWVGALALLAGERPEGDFLVADDTAGWVLLGGGVVVLLGGITGLRRRSSREGSTAARISDTGSPSS